ncbi:hypothetical protein QBC42DRAFT_272288 [Cladorrhinum samala]|uniref:Uncharacterized protein n=1 Tax=Cladorrhinum samala TaxID=585594 RepID=A0AAV9HIG4_9PEZI|nr:hypothetical protein QBC42DRAFT_272288 [Cladorrhinum samala]
MDGKVATPTVLVLSGDSIHYASPDSKTGPIYRLSKSIDSLTHKDSSIRFFSCRQVKGEGEDEEEEGEAKVEARPADGDDDPRLRRRIFNLVHPVNAQYRRDDIAAEYYMTSASVSSSCSSSSLGAGNIKFQISKSFFGKVVEIKAILSAGRNETSSPLFDDDNDDAGPLEKDVLFVAKQKLTIGGKGGFVWIDAKGKEVAREEGNRRLVLTGGRSSLKSDAEEEWMVHALVAVWVLRLWWEVAESSKFKREAELALLQGTGEQSLLSMRWAKKAGIAGLSGAGGAR